MTTKQKHYSGSKKPSTRRSESKGRSHKDLLAMKRAAKRKDLTKEDPHGYGWSGYPGRSRWRSAMRRDESSKRTDAQRARSFKN